MTKCLGSVLQWTAQEVFCKGALGEHFSREQTTWGVFCKEMLQEHFAREILASVL
jgi:hypothetical protein